MDEFIKAFIEWFRNDNHSRIEDFYSEKITSEKLRQLSKNEFIEFINQFAREGGKIQSGGYRTAPQLIENVNKKYEEFDNNANRQLSLADLLYSELNTQPKHLPCR